MQAGRLGVPRRGRYRGLSSCSVWACADCTISTDCDTLLFPLHRYAGKIYVLLAVQGRGHSLLASWRCSSRPAKPSPDHPFRDIPRWLTP